MTIGENIKRLREDAGITQDQLAQRMNVTHSAVSLWESGKRSMNVKTADRLAFILGVTLNDLLKDGEG